MKAPQKHGQPWSFARVWAHGLLLFFLTIASQAALTVSTPSLPAAVLSTPYSQTFGATDGQAPLTWSVMAGALPPGFILNASSGVLSGTPSVTGNFSFQIKVKDATAATASRSYSLKVNATAPLAITTAQTPSATVGIAYSQFINVTGGKPPYKWSVPSGALPDGLALNSNTGEIAGSPLPEGSWIYQYVFQAYITVTDSVSTKAAASFFVSVLPPTTTKYTLTVVNGSGGGAFAPNANVSISASAAPAGQIFTGWTGAAVASPSSSNTTLVMPAANATVTATYGTPNNTAYTLTVVNGSGGGSFTANSTVAITANAASAGQIFAGWIGAPVATPASASTTLLMPPANVTVTATYSTPSSPLSISTKTIPNPTVGTPYSQQLVAVGGKPPYTWSVPSGALPEGLTLNPSGLINGTAIDAGAWIYQYVAQAYITVTDSASKTAAASYFISVLPAPVTKYTLTVVNGSGSGLFAANASVQISASSAPAGQVFANWSGATVALPNSANTTLVMPAANTTVTANYKPTPPPVQKYTLTVVNGSGSGSFAANTSVQISANPAPAGQVFASWTGVSVTDSSSPNTTLFMPAITTAVTATYKPIPPVITDVPQPVTGHPRLWITQADLPRLRSWAVPSNSIYQQGEVPLLNTAIANYNNQFFPGGVQNPNLPDPGDTQGYTGLLCEQHALIFAFHSLIDPSPAARMLYAQRARNLLMAAMNEAAKGVLAGAPFRDPLFPVYNRANANSEAWPLVVDWIYSAMDASNQPILTATDKATIRTVFLLWAKECLNASTTGGDHPSPVGVANSQSLLPGGGAYRMASNNYYLGHARLVTLMSLAFDPIDDPVIDPSSAPAVLGNTLRSYILNATGAWLFQEFAMLGDPATVRAAYGLSPNASVGLASGGLPPEGMLYGHSYAYVIGQLLALKTAGFADTTLSGPQADLANGAPVFGRFMQGMAASLVPAAQVPSAESYLGPIYQMASYGDILRLWITPDFVQPFALLSMLDQQNGDSSRLNAERWFAVNAVEGGAVNLISRIQNPWSYGVQDALLYFLLLDPAAAPATDPRPTYPTAFYDAPQGRLVEHTDWSPNATMFDFRCSWISINHQQADANQFELYRKGEWLTKGVANYDNNIVGLTTDYHNTLSLKNWCSAGVPTSLGWWEGPFWADGSQWQLGNAQGDPTTQVSVQSDYTYIYGDTTALYNRPSVWTPSNAALDILHASRSLVWLKPDHIVIYDRATSHTAGLFKRFNLALIGAPVVSGNHITTTTPGGQHLYISALLPAVSTVSSFAVGADLNPKAELEPTTHRISIEDPSDPTDVRFLHVLQGADGTTPADPTSLVQSNAGTPFEGAVVSDTIVMFKRDVATPFMGTSYTVPATVAHHFVTGLTPDANYTVLGTSGPNNTLQITITGGGNSTTDSAGVLAF